MRVQWIVGILLVVFLVGCGDEKNVGISQKSFATTTWFGGLSQSQKNQHILNSAVNSVIYGYGNECNCKEWARTVVKNASGYQADIPSTCPDWSGWYWCLPHKDVRHIWYIPYAYPIYAAVPGNIVQMNIFGGPHTAIIWSKNATNVCFVDANYINDGCESGYHCQSLNSFVSTAPNHTVYEVTGH